MNKLEFDAVHGFACLLERYFDRLPDNDAHTFPISKKDRKEYDRYFKELVLTDVLDDGRAFEQKDNNTHFGMGSDAEGFRVEYFQMMMQAYRYLYKTLSAEEIFISSGNWYITDTLSEHLPIQQSTTK